MNTTFRIILIAFLSFIPPLFASGMMMFGGSHLENIPGWLHVAAYVVSFGVFYKALGPKKG